MDANINETGNYYYYENISIWKYLEYTRGPQQLTLPVAIPLTVLNVLIFISGLIGNTCVCYVIIKHPALHTATNYYLFNLAVSDLLLLIFGLPNDVSLYWHQYPWELGEGFCKLRALLSEMATYVSVLTIVTFSTERYIAICHPLQLHTMSGFQRAMRIITCLWIGALISALPFSFFSDVHYLTFPPGSDNILEESAFCGMLAQPDHLPLAEASFCLFFLIPMTVIAFQYMAMGIKINRRTKLLSNGTGNSVHSGSSRKNKSQKGIMRMLAAVVLCFFICWAPFHAQRLIVIHGYDLEYFHELNAWMFYVTGILYYFSSTLNPILYNVMSKRYRSAFKEILLGIKPAHSLLRQGSAIKETNVDELKQSLVKRRNRRKRRIFRSTSEGDIKNKRQDIMQLMHIQSDNCISTNIVYLTPESSGVDFNQTSI